MAACYLCGDYIERGGGYRRSVLTGTSTRVYATRHGGASFGVHSGTRTLCATCAEANDRLESGAGWRILLLFLAWICSAIVGWQIIMNVEGGAAVVIGLLCMLGLPALIICGIIEHQRRKGIADDMISAREPNVVEDLDVVLARLPGEDVETWLLRAGPHDREEDMEAWAYFARRHPPAVGQRVSDWMSHWDEWNSETPPVPEASEAEPVFSADDTILTWAESGARYMSSRTGGETEEYRHWIVSSARYVKPRVGERLTDYSDRVARWFETFDRSLDPTSAASATRPGETIAGWVGRIAPLCLAVEDGESLEDVIPKVVRIAEQYPPFEQEAAAAWLGRVAGPIAEMNG